MKGPRNCGGNGQAFDVSHEIADHVFCANWKHRRLSTEDQLKGFRVDLTEKMIGEVRRRMRLQGFDAGSTEAVVDTLSGNEEAAGVHSMDFRMFGEGLIQTDPGRDRSSLDSRKCGLQRS
jgi:hypothetical protein